MPCTAPSAFNGPPHPVLPNSAAGLAVTPVLQVRNLRLRGEVTGLKSQCWEVRDCGVKSRLSTWQLALLVTSHRAWPRACAHHVPTVKWARPSAGRTGSPSGKRTWALRGSLHMSTGGHAASRAALSQQDDRMQLQEPAWPSQRLEVNTNVRWAVPGLHLCYLFSWVSIPCTVKMQRNHLQDNLGGERDGVRPTWRNSYSFAQQTILSPYCAPHYSQVYACSTNSERGSE